MRTIITILRSLIPWHSSIRKDIEVLKQQNEDLKQLTIKNHNIVMATLADFQKVSADISAATQTIAAYVQGTGMSAADQDEALTGLQSAVTALNAAIPAPAAPATTPAQ